MTRLYFVRHAQSDHSRGDDRTRHLTAGGRRMPDGCWNFCGTSGSRPFTVVPWMPYIVELDFDGTRFLSKTEQLYVENVFQP